MCYADSTTATNGRWTESSPVTKNRWRCKGESAAIEDNKFLFIFDSETERENTLNKQPWVILGHLLVRQEITEENFMETHELTHVPFGITFAGLPIQYHSWKAVHGLANMVDTADQDTPTHGHLKKNLGYNAKVWIDVRAPFPTGIPVISIEAP